MYVIWISTPMFVFADIVTGSGLANPVSTARGLSATQWEACMHSLTTQKPKRLPRVYQGHLPFSKMPAPNGFASNAHSTLDINYTPYQIGTISYRYDRTTT